MYWAIPMPRANGSDPRFRSCGRQPSIVVSRVTTSADAPMASARPMNESTSASSVDQYSWYHREPSPIARAVASIGEEPWLDRMYGTPTADAAAPTISSAPRRTSPAAPIGATSIGAGSRIPNSDTDRSREDTSRNILGTRAHRSNAARLARIVAPSPAPPATYAHASPDMAWRAACSRPVASVGTRGRRPSAPAR